MYSDQTDAGPAGMRRLDVRTPEADADSVPHPSGQNAPLESRVLPGPAPGQGSSVPAAAPA
eukprot:8023615-Pyramimonas_sp.AAC.1